MQFMIYSGERTELLLNPLTKRH